MKTIICFILVITLLPLAPLHAQDDTCKAMLQTAIDWNDDFQQAFAEQNDVSDAVNLYLDVIRFQAQFGADDPGDCAELQFLYYLVVDNIKNTQIAVVFQTVGILTDDQAITLIEGYTRQINALMPIMCAVVDDQHPLCP